VANNEINDLELRLKTRLFKSNTVLTYARTQRHSRLTDTQTHKDIDTQTHRRTDTQTHRHTDTQTHRHIDTRHTDTKTPRHTCVVFTKVSSYKPLQHTTTHCNKTCVFDCAGLESLVNTLQKIHTILHDLTFLPLSCSLSSTPIAFSFSCPPTPSRPLLCEKLVSRLRLPSTSAGFEVIL